MLCHTQNHWFLVDKRRPSLKPCLAMESHWAVTAIKPLLKYLTYTEHLFELLYVGCDMLAHNKQTYCTHTFPIITR